MERVNSSDEAVDNDAKDAARVGRLVVIGGGGAGRGGGRNGGEGRGGGGGRRCDVEEESLFAPESLIVGLPRDWISKFLVRIGHGMATFGMFKCT